MKVYYYVDLDRTKAEGRATISRRIKTFLIKEGFTFVNNPKEADIMHFHSSGIFDSYTAYRFKKRYNKPCIFTLYSNSETELFNHFRNYLTQKVILQKTVSNVLLSYTSILPLKVRGFFLKKLDRVIVPTTILKKRMFNNTTVIRIGIDINKFYPQAKISNKLIKVGYFGSSSVHRGFLEYINASQELGNSFEVNLFIKSIPKKVRKYIQNKNPKIKIFGFVEDINKCYNEMDIIVLPFRSPLGVIPNPLVLLEAMATEKAIITTNLNFIKEIVKDGVVMVKPYSSKEIVKAVYQLANNKELRTKLGKKARETIIKEYNQEKMFEEYLKVYKELEEKLKDGKNTQDK